ncbi:aminopeptidase N [Esox lucius]|uniref:Aminopeptidase n=1 Tax=Esox lucius TaxID=8010 RepID=A0A3P9A816_ESOLU|nr:aminopeptidase N [Esox lucius]
MGKGFFISKTLTIAGVIVGAGAVATIIALSVVYSQEKAKNQEVKPTNGGTSPPTTTQVTPWDPWDHYRLPDSLSPVSYNITLWPRLEASRSTGLYIFTGRSAVVFECKKPTDLILIHSNKLNLTLINGHHARLTGLDGATPPNIKDSWLQPVTQFLVIQLDGRLQAGNRYELYSDFTGELADDLGGFYRSEYFVGEIKKVVATTQMQPTHARKAFPCFDEPAMKAVFHMTLLHPHGTVALANGMNVASVNVTVDGQDVTQTSFQATPIMSTYLLAFVVSEFDFIRSPEGEKVLIRIWARKQAIEEGQGDYALEKTGPILEFFEKYYTTDYPLNKSDQIALPDFSAGAMENWGLITYRETALLFNNASSSNADKEWIATVISHELAHMWFGNLVTMRWWNDLWLNEGFATYVSYLGANSAEPTWNYTDLIVMKEVYKVMSVDALASSHPLSTKEQDIMQPAQISELFDSITYSKGAAILRMLSEFLTEPVFARGLSTYLNTFKYGNTVYQDLWNHLQTAANLAPDLELPASIEVIMNRWILQMGFPLVSIDTTNGHITQNHFLLDPESVVDRPSEFQYEWIVPIKWIKSGTEQTPFWLKSKTDTHPPLKMIGSDWVLANTKVSGFFRVNYDTANWERLLTQLSTNHEVIPVINRAQIVDDAFNLARAKTVSTKLALRTTLYLQKEREYMPWEMADRNLGYFFLMFDRSEVYGPMRAYLRKQVMPLFNHFQAITANWTKIPDNHLDQYTQVRAISLACSSGVPVCEALMTSWFQAWMKTPEKNPIHPNLRQTVYCGALAAGGVEEWNFAWKMYKEAPIASEAEKLMYGLTCTREPWLIQRYLTYCLDPEKIRKQDATFTMVYIAGNVVGQSLVWDFVRANWNYIYNDYGSGSFSFGRLIEGITRRFSSEFELKQLQQFIKENSDQGLGSASQAVEQALERTKANIKWVAENKADVFQWFTDNSKLI